MSVDVGVDDLGGDDEVLERRGELRPVMRLVQPQEREYRLSSTIERGSILKASGSSGAGFGLRVDAALLALIASEIKRAVTRDTERR